MGLANNEMRLYMRQYRPENDAVMIGLKQHLISQANVVRKKYLDGEVPPQLLAGVEGKTTQISYMAQGSACSAAYSGVKSMHELFSLDRLNAMENKAQKGQCLNCGSKEHYIGQCPRRRYEPEPSPRVTALNEAADEPRVEEDRVADPDPDPVGCGVFAWIRIRYQISLDPVSAQILEYKQKCR